MPNTTAAERRSTTSRLLPGLAATALAGVLGACAADHYTVTSFAPEDYRQRHPIVLAELIETLDVPVASDSHGLSGRERGTIAGFAQKFKESGSAVIAIVAPAGSANEVAAASAARQIHGVLVKAGVKPTAIDFRAYSAKPKETAAPVRLAFNRIAARTEPCAVWPDQAGSADHNQNYYNFGCATQQNLAAMVASPLDLLYPRGTTPVDAVRRSIVLDNYRRGAPHQGDHSGAVGGDPVARGVGE